MENYIEDIEKISLNILGNKINTIILNEIIFDIKDSNINQKIKWEKQNSPKADFIVFLNNNINSIELTTVFRDSKGVSIRNKKKRYSLFFEKNKVFYDFMSKIAIDIKNILIKNYFLNNINLKFPLSNILLVEINNGKIIFNSTYINDKNKKEIVISSAQDWLGNDILDIIRQSVFKSITIFLRNNHEKILDGQKITFNFKPIDIINFNFEITFERFWPFDQNEEDFSASFTRILSQKIRKKYEFINNLKPQLFILIDFCHPFFFSKNGINWNKTQLLIDLVSKHKWYEKFSKLILYHKNYFLIFSQNEILEYIFLEKDYKWKQTIFK